MLAKNRLSELRKAFNEDFDERAVLVFGALGDRSRFKIFKVLAGRCDACVSDVAEILNVSVPAASQHLRILEMIGIARKERCGHKICYKIRSDDPLVKSLIKLVC